MQACAVDSLIKRCAGPVEDCRIAMLGIMGTPLKMNCACRGTDTMQLYDCLGWQRLLWINPCVGEYLDPSVEQSLISAVTPGYAP